MNLSRNGRREPLVRRETLGMSRKRGLAIIPAIVVSFAIGTVVFPPALIGGETSFGMPSVGGDGGLDVLRRLVGVSPWETVALVVKGLALQGNVMMTGIRPPPLSHPAVLPILPLTTYARAVPSILDSEKTAYLVGRARGISGPQAMFWEASRARGIDSWSDNVRTTWAMPDDWRPTILQGMDPWDLRRVSERCPGSNCPSFGITAARTPPEQSFQGEGTLPEADSGTPASGKVVNSPDTEPGWMELTYESSPGSVAAPTLSLICDKRLPATPSSLLLACDTSNAATGLWGLSFQYSTLEGSLDSSGWNVGLDVGSGFHVTVASALPDLLDGFGVDQTRGIDIRTRGDLQMAGTSASRQVLQQATLPIAELFTGITFQGPTGGGFAGITSRGPAGGIMFTSGQVGGQATALFSAGQVQIAGALIVQAGDLRLGYTWGPDGSGLVGRFKRDPLDLAISLGGSDVQVGLSYTPKGAPTVEASWSGTKGFAIALAAEFKISLGTNDHGAILDASESQPPVTLSTGKGTLILTPPSPADGPSPPSIDLKLPLPAPAQPAARPTPASGAALIVRACVNTEETGVCEPGDATFPLQVLLDGTSVMSTGGEITIAPGHHLVTVPMQAVPPLLVPLRGLKCELTIPASAIATCELPFRRFGVPEKTGGN